MSFEEILKEDAKSPSQRANERSQRELADLHRARPPKKASPGAERRWQREQRRPPRALLPVLGAEAAGNASMVDFLFENPLWGRFKDHPSVQSLLEDHSGMVTRVETSYCHYGYKYQKPSVFIGTLTNLQLSKPCPRNPCIYLTRDEVHPERSAECNVAQKNSLPPELIDAIIQAWMDRRPTASAYLLVDVFSGWGSLEKRIETNWPTLKTFANDWGKRDHTDAQFDMGAESKLGPEHLVALAIWKHYREEVDDVVATDGGAMAWLKNQNIAVLFHCSTPCRTYSTQAIKVHREVNSAIPKTDAARHDDAMNQALISYFEDVVLSLHVEQTRK